MARGASWLLWGTALFQVQCLLLWSLSLLSLPHYSVALSCSGAPLSCSRSFSFLFVTWPSRPVTMCFPLPGTESHWTCSPGNATLSVASRGTWATAQGPYNTQTRSAQPLTLSALFWGCFSPPSFTFLGTPFPQGQASRVLLFGWGPSFPLQSTEDSCKHPHCHHFHCQLPGFIPTQSPPALLSSIFLSGLLLQPNCLLCGLTLIGLF